MPFDLSAYEPVEDRLRAFWSEHPNGRVITELVHTGADGYIVKASVFKSVYVTAGGTLPTPTRDNDYPDATGFAQEAVTEKGVNATSALENCETSAIGRALANLGYAAKGKRPSREEMSKSSARSESSPAVMPGVVGLGTHGDPNDRADQPAVDGSNPAGSVSADTAAERPGEVTHTASPGPTSPAGIGEGPNGATGSPGGALQETDPAPPGHLFTVKASECSHRTPTGDWVATVQVNGQPRCSLCGTPAVKFREAS